MCLAWVVQSAQVPQCQLVGGLIADEHGSKSELYSRKASVMDFLRWIERLLIVQLEQTFLSGSGVFVGEGWSIHLETVISDVPGIDDASWRQSTQHFHFE